MEKFEKKELTKKSKNFSRWYNDVILKAALADYAPVKGCMIIRPYGYALWENIQSALDKMIKAAGIKNAYFPLFIPESFLKKEKEHVEGFSPQLAMVTIGGGEKLEEELVVRPTSETVMYAMYAKWIKSWRDLPLLINQWCNVVRWEKRTYLFLRTTEFLWQEGHTVHTTHQEAKTEVDRALKMYIKLYKEWLALPAYFGRKSEKEKFPGAVNTYAYEMLMPDGKVLQGCTSHDLGQNFSKPFKIQFQDEKGKLRYGWQTSWGLSTRAIGGLIMAHGDDNGLILPPKIAPIQVVIIPVCKSDEKDILRKAEELKEKLGEEFRVELDNRQNYSLGYKINDWELKGVPLRIEIGEQEVRGGYVTVVRRDESQKSKVKSQKCRSKVKSLLGEIQKNLLEKAEQFLRDNTYEVKDFEEFKNIMKTKRGFIKAFWCEDEKCEEKIKEETKASTRCLPAGAKKAKGKCVYCGKPASYQWLFGQAY